MDEKAKKIWENGEADEPAGLDKTAPESLSDFVKAGGAVKVYTFGSTKYIAYVAQQPKDSNNAKASWMGEAKTLHTKVVAQQLSKSENGQIHTDSGADASKKDVDFGTAFVSKTEEGTTTKYVIVVFKVN